jgi:abortive infection bacteriophage resistance protein
MTTTKKKLVIEEINNEEEEEMNFKDWLLVDVEDFKESNKNYKTVGPYILHHTIGEGITGKVKLGEHEFT